MRPIKYSKAAVTSPATPSVVNQQEILTAAKSQWKRIATGTAHHQTVQMIASCSAPMQAAQKQNATMPPFSMKPSWELMETSVRED